MPELPEELAEQLVRTVRALRAMELKKAPSIAESIDWAHTLLALGLDTLDEAAVSSTLGVVLKHASDQARAISQLKLVMSLLDRTVEFAGALRQAGIPVSTAETVDAMRALGKIDIVEREQLRAAFAATSCKRAAHRPTFDTLFDLWFPPKIGDGVGDEEFDGAGEGEGDGEPMDAGELSKAMRDQLRDLLLDGDEDAIRRFARAAVSSLGRTDSPAGRQSYFAYRVLRALSPETLIASLLAAMLGDQERGGLAEKVARQTIADRIKAFEEAVESEVRRRLAETKGVESVTRSAVKPLTDQVDFLRASRNDLIELRRQVQPLARRLATRLTAKRRLGRARQARLPAHRAGLARHRRRAAGDQAQAAQAAQAGAGRVLRRLGLGELVRALHADADPRAAGAVLEGAGVRVHRHLRRGHRLPALGRHRRRHGPHRAERRPGLVRRPQRLRPRLRGVRREVSRRDHPEDVAAGARRRA